MKTDKSSGLTSTFFQFGMAVYLAIFLFLFHFYHVSKDIFRGDLGTTFFTVPTKGLDFQYLFPLASRIFTQYGEYSLCPPLATVTYYPLTFFSVGTAYLIFSYLLIFFLFSCIYLCLRENKTFPLKGTTAFVALVCTVLFYHTYPFMFEVERGNFDMLAMFFAVIGLFSLSRNFRKTAAVTLAVAAQYKVYPFILGGILFLRCGWAMLGLFLGANVLLMFIRGPQPFFDLFSAIPELMKHPSLWPGNHSLSSFAKEMVRLGYLPSDLQSAFFQTLSITVMLIFTLTFLWSWIKRKPKTAVPFSVAEAGLIGMSFQLMSLLPHISNDYKLVIHIFPFLLLITRKRADFALPEIWQYILIAVLAASVAFLFVPFFLIKTFGVLSSFFVYTVFTFSPGKSAPAPLPEGPAAKPA